MLLPLVLTLTAMRQGEKDQPWPVARGATYLERDDLEEREEQAAAAREQGAASSCAERIYRLREEDKLGRYVILVVYFGLNIYLFFEAYFRWVLIVDNQGDCTSSCEGECSVDLLCLSDGGVKIHVTDTCEAKGDTCLGLCPAELQSCANLAQRFDDGRIMCQNLDSDGNGCVKQLSYWAPIAKAAGACVFI